MESKNTSEGSTDMSASGQTSILNRQRIISDPDIKSLRDRKPPEKKLAIVEPLKGEQVLSSPVTLPDGESCARDPTSGKCISFATPKPENTPHHRLSISCIPNKTRPKVTDPTMAKEGASKDQQQQNEGDDGVEEKNCTVDMPGNFVYLPSSSDDKQDADEGKEIKKTITNETPIILPEDNGPECKKIVFKKQANAVEPEVPFTAFFAKEDEKKFLILIGATGSVASI